MGVQASNELHAFLYELVSGASVPLVLDLAEQAPQNDKKLIPNHSIATVLRTQPTLALSVQHRKQN